MTRTDPVSSKSPLASISANAAPRAISPDPEEGPARISSNPTPVYPSLRQLCDARPSLHAIWASVTAPRIARLRNALSLHTASLRVDYATAFLEARAALAPGGDSDRADPAIAAAASARALTAEFLAALLATPTPRHKYAPKRIDTIRESLVAVIGPGPEDDFSPHTPEITRHVPGPLPAFEHTTHMCMAALCDGWEVDECIRMWAQVHTGTFSRSGRTVSGPARTGPTRSTTTGPPCRCALSPGLLARPRSAFTFHTVKSLPSQPATGSGSGPGLPKVRPPAPLTTSPHS